MLQYPKFNPVILSITDTLQIRWYGFLYVIAFVGCWLLFRFRVRHLAEWHRGDSQMDILFYVALGVILGGRIGYLLFYALGDFFDDPLLLFRVWEGGMSFHGGLLGVIIAIWFFCRKYKQSFLAIGDLIAPVIPFGIFCGRLGNFINGELWGKATTMPWGMVFPEAGNLPRHPSQLYAMGLEGILLFLLLWIYSAKSRATGCVSGVFLMAYALVRVLEEFFRQPDPQYGYLAFGWLTMGQLLCVPMLLLGLVLYWWAKKSEDNVLRQY